MEPAPPSRFPEGTQDLSGEPGLVPITRIMSCPVYALAPETSIAEARVILRERGVHGAPVVDAGRRPLGMVSRGDLARAVEADSAAVSAPVADVMMCFVLAIPSGSSLGRAAALMAYEGVHRVLVTGDDGRVVGIVSALDVAAWIGKQAGYLQSSRRRK